MMKIPSYIFLYFFLSSQALSKKSRREGDVFLFYCLVVDCQLTPVKFLVALYTFFSGSYTKKECIEFFVGRHQMWKKYSGFLGHRFIS